MVVVSVEPSMVSRRLPSLFGALVFASVLANRAHAEEQYFPAWPEALQSDVVKASRGFPGEFSVYVKDLSTGTVPMAHSTVWATTGKRLLL